MGSFSDNRQVKSARDVNLGRLCTNAMGIISTKVEVHGANDVSLTCRANKDTDNWYITYTWVTKSGRHKFKDVYP